MVIDINLDDGLLDGMAAMQKFCKIAVTEPDVSKVNQETSNRGKKRGGVPGRCVGDSAGAGTNRKRCVALSRIFCVSQAPVSVYIFLKAVFVSSVGYRSICLSACGNLYRHRKYLAKDSLLSRMVRWRFSSSTVSVAIPPLCSCTLERCVCWRARASFSEASP